MRANPGDAWQRHTAEQVVSVHGAGFVWLARVRLAPFLSASVLDAFVDGEGLLEVRLLGSLRLARSSGPQISRGELMRNLAELPWAPNAMLHNPHLRWRELGGSPVEDAFWMGVRPGVRPKGSRDPHRPGRRAAGAASRNLRAMRSSVR